jgi:tetratricopeptide (TPR) repeat protein
VTMRRRLHVAVMMVLMMTAILILQRELVARRTEQSSATEVEKLPDADVLAFMSLGFEEVMSDFYWVKAVLYEGRESGEKDYSYFSSLIDLSTSLDPYFQYPYLFGSVILAVMAGDYEASDRLLMKGYALHGESWRFPFGLGYNAYFHDGDAKRAARYLSVAAHLDRSPAYLPRLVTRLYHESGSLDVAIRFLETVLADAGEGEQSLELRKRLEALRSMHYLEHAVSRYHREQGQDPAAIEDLVTAGTVKEIPDDPYGGRFYLDEDGSIRSTSRLRPVVVHGDKGGV